MATKYASLPAPWSNKRKVERLRVDAFESLTRMLSRAVAETGVNFSIWSALRTTAEQHALFVKNYRNTGKSYANGDRPRKYKGTYWARRPGSVAVAVPGSARANHEGGVAIDIHPAAIQTWIKRNGGRFGWDWAEGKRNNEDWHFRYYPSQDGYKSEGLLDHAAVQKAVGAKVDGKIGTGTVAKIKAWQKSKGLTADGKVGPATKRAMGLSGKGESAPVVVAPAPDPVVVAPVVPGRFIPRSEWLGIAKAAVVLADHPDRVQTEIYIHYPGQAATIGAATEASTKNRLSGYYRSHVTGEYNDIAYNLAVDQSGNVWELRGVDRQSGANGGTVSNRRGQSILVLVGNNEAPSSAALAGIEDAIKRVRAAHPTATKVLGHQQSPDASTACPGASLMALIRAGKIGTGTPAEGAPVVKSPASSAPAKSGRVTEDGRAGRETIAALQRALGVTADGRAGEGTWRALQRKLGVKPADGKIGWQSYRPHELGNGIVDRATAWGFTGRRSKGSPTVRALQRHIGLTGRNADGTWFEGTTKALQRALNAGRF